MKRKQTEILRTRVESCISSYSTAEEITDYLRSKYYPRHKRQQLIQLVENELYSIRNENHDHVKRPYLSQNTRINIDDDDDDDDDDEEATLQTTTTSCDSVMGLSGTESNGGMSEEDKELGFKGLGGMEDIFEELKPDILLLRYPELSKGLGVKPTGGILLYGLPGCGKTKLAKAIAFELGFNFYSKSATDFVSAVSGSSEESIRKLFSEAKRTAPSVVFIDEIDAIASKRENSQRQMETRIVTQLMVCMDEANNGSGTSEDELPRYVLVIGATNMPDAIEPALRRPGRFDSEIHIGIPNESAREEILKVVTRGQKHDGSVCLRKIAKLTPGFVGADLEALAKMAGKVAVRRMLDEGLLKEPFLPQDIKKCVKECAFTMSDFEVAAKEVQPVVEMAEIRPNNNNLQNNKKGFDPIPNVKWEDVGALDFVRKELDFYIIWRLKYPEIYEGFEMYLHTGFLLYGPPGCGKTLIAKAVAKEAGANFIHVEGPGLLDKLVGESEKEVRKIFSRARTCAPCIIFFDEVDALTTKRGTEGTRVIEGVLNQLLVELDGGKQRKGVFVIGATNRPEVMDRAILRPGRLGKHLYVPLPSPDDRVKILKTLVKGKPVDANVDLNAIGRTKDCDNFSGADLAALMGEASRACIEERCTSIKTSHFEVALSKVSSSAMAELSAYGGVP